MKFRRHLLVALVLCLPCFQQLTHAADSCVMPVPDLEAVFGHSPGTAPTELQRIPADNYTQCVTQCCNSTEGQCNVLVFKSLSANDTVTQAPNCVLYHCDSLDGCLISPEAGVQIYADSKAVAKSITQSASKTAPGSAELTTLTAPPQQENPATTGSDTVTTHASEYLTKPATATVTETQAVTATANVTANTTTESQRDAAESNDPNSTPVGGDGDKRTTTGVSPTTASSANIQAPTASSTATSGEGVITSNSTYSSSSTKAATASPDSVPSSTVMPELSTTTNASRPKTTTTATVSEYGGENAGGDHTISSSNTTMSTTNSISPTGQPPKDTTLSESVAETSGGTLGAATGSNDSTVGKDFMAGPESGTNTTGLSDADGILSINNVTTLGLLISALTLGCTFFLVATAFVGKRVYDSWKKRHYNRVERDYLIDGMYAE